MWNFDVKYKILAHIIFNILAYGVRIMFGFGGGESSEIVARKKGYMKDAQAKWRFLTSYDLSSIKSKWELAAMVQTRSSISDAQASSDVDGWMVGKQF